MPRTFVIKLTHGIDDPERVAVALTVATTALASGVPVELFLMHDAVALARPGGLDAVTVAHSPPAPEMFAAVLGAGAPVYACTQCMMRRGMSETDLIAGVVQGGAVQLVASLAADGAQSLDF